MRIWPVVACITALGAGVALAQHGDKGRHHQPYAGQQSRSVASLSAEDVQAFLDGRGMGLAKSAEINGYPGPMHVLELADELKLTGEQRRAVTQAFERMKAKATDLGARYIAAEKAVDDAFKSGNADAAVVAARVAEANRLLGEVRLSHLVAHVEITPLLSPEQRARYAELRGYGGGAAPMHGSHKH
ncbi:MAG: periplasmic heavy metal sensor [Hyphomicrobiaceae bacterium]|nr:MAG: periplasmic heavy metal sensor [Hyphomicrobiaceae bacterium]